MSKSLRELLEQNSRTVAGLMSGTSLDGVDCAVTRIGGSGRTVRLDVLGFATLPYSDELRELLVRNSAVEGSSVRDISQLNFRLASVYRDAVKEACRLADLQLSDIDAVGSHGQTIHHVPEAADCAGEPVRSTLQIGDPSVLANLLGVATVGDFRVADMALGGQGAPLVPYLDFVVFGSESENRVLLNIGGIANITLLPSAVSAEQVIAFDTGPGNMLIDGAMQRLFDRRFDEGGEVGSSGSVCQPILDDLLADPYYDQQPPKSTGREKYTAAVLDRILSDAQEAGCSSADVISTLSELTAQTISGAIGRFVSTRWQPARIIAAGGGVHNRYIMERLRNLMPDIELVTADSVGIDADAKEAVCFALLAHETLNGHPTNLPSVTGASHGTVLGKICVPF